MSLPDLIDERFEALVHELRAGRVGAPLELRERVRRIAVREPEPGRRRRPSFRRAAPVLAAAAVAVAVGGAVVAGVLTSGSSKRAGPTSNALEAASGKAPTAGSTVAGASAPAADAARGVAPSRSRAQQYEAEMRVRVRDLSGSTKRALRLTRALGGYVRSVDYGSGRSGGDAFLVVRIPVGSVQEAIVRFSSLGSILEQRISVRDVQPELDRRFRRLQALRRQIAALQRTGGSEAQAKIARLRRQLAALQREQAQAERRAGYATVSLALTTRPHAAVVQPGKPGRLERALDRSGSILLGELAVLLYAVIVGGPVLALAGLGLLGARFLRRRSDERLLAR